MIPDASPVTVSGGTLAMNGFDETVGTVVLSGGTISGAGTLTGSAYDLRNGTCGSALGGPGASATKTTASVVTLTGANSYDGGTTLSAGQIRVGANSALGTGKLTISGAGVRLSGNNATSRTLSIPVDLGSDVILGEATPGNGNLSIQTGAFTIVGASRQITVDTVTATIGSIIGEDAAGRGLAKAGGGTLVLSGNNTYSGDTSINAGAISLDGSVVTPFGSGGAIILNGGNMVISADRGTSANNLRNSLSLTGDSQFQSAGTTGTRNLVFGGAWTTTGGSLTIHETGTGAGPATFNVRFTNAFTFSRPLAFVADTAGHSINLDVWNRADVGDQTYSGLISGPGSIKRSVTTGNTGGKVTFTAQNTYSGGTTLNDGEIALGSACTGAPDAPTSGPLGTGTLTIGNDAGKLSASGGTVNLFNHIVFTASSGQHLTFLGANDLELSGNVNLGGQTVTFTNNNSGVAKLSGVISNGNLSKEAAGTLTLSGANTYTGPTLIDAGTLAISGSGSVAFSSDVTVGSGATLDVSGATGGTYALANGQTLRGKGTVNGTIVVPGGAFLSPGFAGGVIGTLTLNNSPSLSGTISGSLDTTSVPNASKVSLAGPIAYGGTLNVVNFGPGLVGGETFDLFDATSFSGSFSSITLPSLGAGLNWWTDRLSVDGTITVNRAPVAVDKTYTRGKGASLKIRKADLTGSDPDAGDSSSYDALPGTGSQGATVSEDATFVYYKPANDNPDTLQYRVKDTRGGTTTKNIQINVVNATGQATTVTVNGSTATVSFAGIPGFSYDIQRSTNMVDWVTMLTTNTPADGLFEYVDDFSDLGAPPSAAYYRLHQP